MIEISTMANWVWEQVVSGNVANTCSNIMNTYQVFKDFLQRHEKVDFKQDEFTPLLEKILYENEALRQDLTTLMPIQSVNFAPKIDIFNNNNGTITNNGTIQIDASYSSK